MVLIQTSCVYVIKFCPCPTLAIANFWLGTVGVETKYALRSK